MAVAGDWLGRTGFLLRRLEGSLEVRGRLSEHHGVPRIQKDLMRD